MPGSNYRTATTGINDADESSPYDKAGRLRFTARTAPLSATARRKADGRLSPGGAEHPWQHRRFSAGRGTRELIDHRPGVSDVVVEFAGDGALRW